MRSNGEIRAFLEGPAVASVAGTEFFDSPSRKDLVAAIRASFARVNFQATNAELGDVRLTKSGINDSMRHGYGREKIAAFAAVPEIIAKGLVVRAAEDWKSRGYESFVIAAPIAIGEIPYCAFVVVNRMQNGDQNFYLHEVGKLEEIKKLAEGLRSGLAPAQGKANPSFGSIKSIAFSIFAVNGA